MYVFSWPVAMKERNCSFYSALYLKLSVDSEIFNGVNSKSLVLISSFIKFVRIYHEVGMLLLLLRH